MHTVGRNATVSAFHTGRVRPTRSLGFTIAIAWLKLGAGLPSRLDRRRWLRFQRSMKSGRVGFPSYSDPCGAGS